MLNLSAPVLKEIELLNDAGLSVALLLQCCV